MLHHSGRYRGRRPGRVRHARLRFNLADFGALNEGNRRVAHPHEAVKGFVDAMHPIERDQVHTDGLREELDLLLDVLGANSEVMNSVRKTHGNLPAGNVRSASESRIVRA